MTKRVDLHMHSQASDGTWSTKEIIDEVKSKGIEVFSVTDHDVIDTSLELYQMKKKGSLQESFVIGVETSVTYKGKEYHITVYDFDPTNVRFLNLIRKNHDMRESADRQLIVWLNDEGKLPGMEDYEKYAYDPKLGGWKSLHYLKEKGLVANWKDFIKLASGSDIQLVFNDPREAIEAIKEAGGHCFLAHPSAYTGGTRLEEEILDQFREMGIEGLECYSPYITDEEDTKYYIDYCTKHGLQISGGSDCHGTFNNRELGQPHITVDDLRLSFIE